MSDSAVFTAYDVESYAAIINGCDSETGCKWTPDHGATVIEGVMRRLHGEPGSDVRECEVQISGTTEWFIPITTIVQWYRANEFFIKPR